MGDVLIHPRNVLKHADGIAGVSTEVVIQDFQRFIGVLHATLSSSML